MPYQFTKDLETGNVKIDTQHQQLIEAINRLLEACGKGQGRANLEQTTEFLYNYTTKHFADEEQMQIQARYPDYVQHHRAHEEFKRVVKDLNQQLKENGPSIVLVGQVNSAIAGWLIQHIKREDVKVANYLRSLETNK